MGSRHHTTVIIISCGARKRSSDPQVKIPAGELYTGSYHRAARRAAAALTSNGRTGPTFVLSARHGICRLDDPIAPYDMRMHDAGCVSAKRLRSQAVDLGIQDARVTVLGPRAYVQAARQVWGDNVTAPLEGSRGIGDQLARLAMISRTGQLPAPSTAPPQTTVSLVDEIEDAAHIRLAAQEEEAAAKRAVFARCSRLQIVRQDLGQARITFPGTAAKAAARHTAAGRFAPRYQVQAQPVYGNRCALDVQGTPRNVARFLSALPRILEGAEIRTTQAARMYGRWERHSSSDPHLAELAPRRRAALARQFRAQAFEEVIGALLERPQEVAEAEPGVPFWDQVHALAGGIASYYWFDPADSEDADETARFLAYADRDSALRR